MRVASPPILHSCFMGVDMARDHDLIAAGKSVEEIRQHIGADTLAYLSLDGMMRAIGATDGYCNACFTGVYPHGLGRGAMPRWRSRASSDSPRPGWRQRVNVLIVGSGGREHALAWKVAQSPRVEQRVDRPGQRRHGHPGGRQDATWPCAAEDVPGLAAFARSRQALI